MRLDKALVEQFWLTRNRAKQLILAWLVSVDEWQVLRPSLNISENANICIKEDSRIHWVSRSAKKLDDFLWAHSDICIEGKVGLDVGSSTGGFTQVLLERWIQCVDAVDVGNGQLHDSLRQNPKVNSFENTDIRDFHSSKKYDIIVCDASFVSLWVLLEAIISLSCQKTIFILLFKPQFEVGRQNLRKTGVPKNEKCIQEAMQKFEKNLSEHWLQILKKEKSSLQWEAGNQEWIYMLSMNYKKTIL